MLEYNYCVEECDASLNYYPHEEDWACWEWFCETGYYTEGGVCVDECDQQGDYPYGITLYNAEDEEIRLCIADCGDP